MSDIHWSDFVGCQPVWAFNLISMYCPLERHTLKEIKYFQIYRESIQNIIQFSKDNYNLTLVAPLKLKLLAYEYQEVKTAILGPPRRFLTCFYSPNESLFVSQWGTLYFCDSSSTVDNCKWFTGFLLLYYSLLILKLFAWIF